jgi:DNA-binding MarR family transcriptional regulator
MGLKEELGFPNPIENAAHEAVLNILVTADLLAKEGERVARPHGLTEAQLNVLMILRYQSRNGELDQSTLGRMLVVNRSNVTGLVDRMEEAGWVRRGPDAQDRRVKQVGLTAEGKRVLKVAEKAYLRRVEEVVSCLAAAEQGALRSALEKLREKLRG